MSLNASSETANSDLNRGFDTGEPIKADESLSGGELFKKLMEDIFASRHEPVQPSLDNSGKPQDDVRQNLRVNDDEEIRKDDGRQNFSVLRAFPYIDKPGSKLKLSKEVPVPPEYPGAPYKDEMVGDLWLGPEYPTIVAKLQSGDLSREEKINLSNEKARLYVAAEQAGNWRYGPLNERKTTTVKTKLTFEKADKPTQTTSSVDNGELKYYDEDRIPHQIVDTNPEPEPEPEEKDSLLQKTWKWVKKGFKDFDEYATRHRTESKLLAVLGGVAGGGSAAFGAYCAEAALAASFPPLAIAAVGIGAGLSLNFAFKEIYNNLYINPKYKKESKLALDNINEQEYRNNVELDRKGRINAFAIADIMAKILGGTVLANILHPHFGSSSPDHQVPAPQDGLHGPVPDSTVNPVNIQPDHSPDFPYQTSTEHVASAAPVPEIPHNLVDYVVKASDNSWEQVLHQNGLETMGPDSIKALEINHDNLVKMWTKWASENGHDAIRINMGPDAKMEYVPVDDVVKMLDEAIRNGYPTEALAKQDYAEYARQLANYERVTKWVLPGTHLQFPAK